MPKGKHKRRIQMGNISLLLKLITQLYGPKHLWITEYGYQTNPPDKTIFGISWAKQAQYMKQAYAMARKNPRIDMMLWFLVSDEPSIGGWQSGLETVTGKKKPAWNAFLASARLGQVLDRSPEALLEGDLRRVAEDPLRFERSAHESLRSPGAGDAPGDGLAEDLPDRLSDPVHACGRTGRDVEDLPADVLGLPGEHRRIDDVVHEGEVARLLAVPEDVIVSPAAIFVMNSGIAAAYCEMGLCRGPKTLK